MSAAETVFDAVAARLAPEPGVGEGRAFRSRSLTVGGKIFAMLVADALVVKLPADRCAQLVEGGDAAVFQSGKRRMREWVSVGQVDEATWHALAGEALAFVGG